MKTIKEYLGKVSITCNGLWDIQRNYDRLCLVHDGFFASYISRKEVPAGISLNNEEYWQPVANLKEDVKLGFTDLETKITKLIAFVQTKLAGARIVVNDIKERDALTSSEVAAGCEVYVKETQQSWILDSIVIPGDTKSWHLETDSKIDSEEKYELSGTFDTLTADRAIRDGLGNIIHDTYITRETVHTYVGSVIQEFLNDWRYEIQDNTITYDMLSEQLKQYIGSNGSITNMPDEEDLTVVNNQLKFKDREYKEDEFSGKGYTILRKNWLGTINLLEQSMINKPNTVYEVRYLFCLNGNTIAIPENSVLYLNGGQFNNGTIELNETPIRGIYKLSDFGTATITGTFAKGQLLYIDDREAMCVWSGTEWINIYGVKFRWNTDNSIDISYDNGNTWNDLSPVFTNQLAIKGIVNSTANIPSNAAVGDIYSVGPTYASDDTEHTKPIYSLYLVTSSGNVSLGNYNSISAGVVQEEGTSTTEVMSQAAVTDFVLSTHEIDHMDPIGVNDNYLLDVESIQPTITRKVNTFKRSNGILYGITIKHSNFFDTGNQGSVWDLTGATAVIKIKKNHSPNRVFQIQESSGGEGTFKEDVSVGTIYRLNSSDTIYGYILKTDDEYIWFYTRTTYIAHGYNSAFALTLRSYKDSSKSEYEELIIDYDNSFILREVEYLPEEINLNKRYYRRYEKLHSNLAGKNILFFGDSLNSVTDYLCADWGANIYSINVSGGRASYQTNNESTWVFADSFIDNFRNKNITKIDYIIISLGVNDRTDYQEPSSEDIAFCINNKKWFDDDSQDNDFSSLTESDKLRFTSLPCIYAAMYSLGKVYPDAAFALACPGRTPNTPATVNGYTPEQYSTILFNGRFISTWENYRQICLRSGAIYIENFTRSYLGNAQKHHPSDGTHYDDIIHQDFASNIGHALSKIY